MIRDVLAGGIKSRALLTSTSVADSRRAAAAGIPAAVICAGEPDLDEVADAGMWGVVLCPRDATAKTITAARARGLEVLLLRGRHRAPGAGLPAAGSRTDS